jgi:hypothetical protein
LSILRSLHRGHFNFAERGHYHFALTKSKSPLTYQPVFAKLYASTRVTTVLQRI